MAETLDYRSPFPLRTRELTPQKKKLTTSFLHIYNNNYIYLIIKTHKHTHARMHARSHTNKEIEHQIHDSHSKSQGQPCPSLIM